MQAPLAIRLRGVVKRFGEITAVDGLDLDVPEGTCVGLLGPNGAGKSTTMKMLIGQAIPDEGSIEVLGFTVPQDSKQARALMGVVPQLDNLDVELTARQNLAVFARLYRVPRHERRHAVDYALQIANLVERADTPVDKLSGGMRRRLLIARALVHKPRLVLLDEPTVGLDPQVRQELWALIDALRSEGTSILMSTHYIEEAERLADTVTIMSHGEAVATGRPAELIEQHQPRPVHERARDQQAPAHASGELVGARVAAVGEVGHLERALDRLAALRARHAVEVGEDAQVLLDRQRGVEVVQLRHDAHLRARSLRVARQLVVEDPDRALVGDRLGGQQLHRRRLAGAVGPEQADARALGHVEVEAVHRGDRPEALDDSAQADGGTPVHASQHGARPGSNRGG
jgi:lipooligosaccharide transport system ATP-binding protein